MIQVYAIDEDDGSGNPTIRLSRDAAMREWLECLVGEVAVSSTYRFNKHNRGLDPQQEVLVDCVQAAWRDPEVVTEPLRIAEQVTDHLLARFPGLHNDLVAITQIDDESMRLLERAVPRDDMVAWINESVGDFTEAEMIEFNARWKACQPETTEESEA
jgi:hypothetical protein